jgi:polysaccharide biosynthesis protein PslH
MLATGSTQTSSSPRLRVLVVSPYFPFPPTFGATMRIYQLIRQLAERHDVTLLSYGSDDDDAGARELSESISVRTVHRGEETVLGRRLGQVRAIASGQPFATWVLRSKEMQAAIDDLCMRIDFDLIHVEFSTMSGFRFPPGIPLVVDEHNIEYELYRRLYEGERSLLRRGFNGPHAGVHGDLGPGGADGPRRGSVHTDGRGVERGRSRVLCTVVGGD